MNPSIDYLSSKDSLVESIGSRLMESSGAEGLKDNIVVFPGRRPAHFLRRDLARRVKGAFKPPDILSMDEFVEWSCRAEGLNSPELGALDASAVIHEQCGAEIGSFIRHSGEVFKFDDFFAWGLEIFSSFEDLKINLVSKRSLSGFDSLLDDAGDFRGDFNRFAAAYEKFYGWTEKEGLVTRSGRYSFLSSRLDRTLTDLKGRKSILFAGFFAFTQSEKEILRRISALPNAGFLFHKGPGLSENLGFLGQQGKESNERIDWRGKVRFHKASDQHGEIFALNQALEKTLKEERTLSSSHVIVLPEPSALFPVLNWTLPLAKDGYNVSMGYPLAASPLYSVIESLFALLDSSIGETFQTDAYIRFVLHPYIKNIECKGTSEISRIIFHGVEETLARNLTKAITLENIEKGVYAHGKTGLLEFIFKRLASRAEIRSVDEVREHIQSVHDSAIRPFKRIESLGDFSNKLLDLISLISKKSTAHLHDNYDKFVQALIECLHELKNSRLAGMKFEENSSYFRILRRTLNDASTHFSGTPLKGLQALGFLETRGLKFSHVWFLDANEGVIPSFKKEDALLPYKIRRELGLSTHKTQEDIYKYYFNVLLGQAGSVDLFYLDTPDREPSRFVRRIMWDMQKAEKKYGVQEQDVRFKVTFSQGNAAAVKKTPEMLKFTAANVNLSPSNLDQYLACPLKFYYGSILGFDEKEGFSSDFEAKDVGILVHDILKTFFEVKLGAPLKITPEDYKRIEAVTDECFGRKYSSIEDGFGYIVKSQVKKRLKEILKIHEGMNNVEIICVEQRMEAAYKCGDYDLRLVGKIDRIDRRDGMVRVIDYKTGSSGSLPSVEDSDFADRDAWPNKIKSVQLPFYILLYLQSNPGARIEGMEASLVVLGKLRGNMEEQLFMREVRGKGVFLDKADYFKKCKGIIDALIKDIFDSEIPFLPTQNKETCASCDFKLFCGKQWAVKPDKY